MIECINVTFDDCKLPSLLEEDLNETLKFENVHDSYLEMDDEYEPTKTKTTSGNEESNPSN